MRTDSDVLVLDTSVLVDVARHNRSGQAILSKYSLRSRVDRPLISVITTGELLAIARSRAWNDAQTTALAGLLAEFVQLEITPEVVDAYADLVTLCRSQNHTMGQQNDMWIAAATRAAGGVLLTGDTDFQWLNPQFIRVEYIARQA